MIELQGSIDIQQSALHQKLETLTIGSLCMRPGVLALCPPLPNSVLFLFLFYLLVHI